MNKFIFFPALLVLIVHLLSTTNSQSESNIIPKNWWNDPSLLKQAEHPIQTQLNTGIGMNATAWDMANVKDARLFIIYVSLFQTLNKKDQETLFREQSNWLKMRRSEITKLDNPDGGSAVTLDKAYKHIEITDARIQELQKRLKQ